jgi:rhomboid protease GluP
MHPSTSTSGPVSRYPGIPTYLPDPVPPDAAGVARAPTANRWLRIPVDRPVLTPALLAVLAIIFLPMALSSDINQTIFQWGANQHIRVMGGEWYRLVTSTFLHGGWLHIIFNGYALYLIGRELEGFMGRARFAAVYAISGLAGSVASFIFSPANVASVGASGAIFGLIGALGVYFGLHRNLFGRLGNAQFWNIIVVIVINLAIGFSGVLPVDNSAHLGGLLAGAAVGFVLVPRYSLGDWYNPLARQVINVNRGRLPWIATALIGLIVVFIFIAALLMFQAGILSPSYISG